MTLSQETKQFIGEIYERCLTLVENVHNSGYAVYGELLISGDLDIRLYDTQKETFVRLAGDCVPLLGNDLKPNTDCFKVIDDIRDYYRTVINNKEARRRAEIERLERELAYLKAEEA